MKTSCPSALSDKRAAYKILGFQSLVWMFFCFLALMVEPSALLSVFLAGGLGVLGSLSLLWFGFRASGAQQAKQILNGMYLGVIYKFLLVVVGVIAVTRIGSDGSVNWVWFLSAFSAVQLAPGVFLPWLQRALLSAHQVS